MRASKSNIAIVGALWFALLIAVVPVVASGASSALRSETIWMASAPVLAEPSSATGIPVGSGPAEEARNISLDFHAADITDVLKALSMQSGTNIVTGTDVKGQVTVSLSHVGLTEALDMITKLSGFKYAMVGPNTFAVGTTDGLAAVLGTPNTPTQNMSVEVVALQYANGDDLARTIPELIPGVKASFGNTIPPADEKKDPLWDVTKPGNDPTARVKLSSKLLRVLILVGEPQAVAQAKDVALKAEDAAKTCGGQIITEVFYPKYTDVTELGQVASSMAPGVTVSLGATTNFQIKAGDGLKSSIADEGGAYEFKAQPATLVLTGPIGDVKRVVAALKEIDIRPSQILIEAKVVDINNDTAKDLGVEWKWDSFTTSGGTDIANSNIRTGSGSSSMKDENATTSGSRFGDTGTLLDNTIAAAAGTDLKRTVARTFSLGMPTVLSNLKLMVTNGKARLLASPKVAAVEGKAANIFIGDELKYIISIQTTPTGQNITTDTALVGIQLKAMGIVGADGDITLNLHPEVSTVTSYLDLGNGIALPQIARRFTDSTIRVKDGQTVIIGGLIRDQDIQNMSKIPILGDLPFFGQLFKQRDHTKKHSEVVIFITATILKDNAPIDPVVIPSI